jgi:hypothetical protein
MSKVAVFEGLVVDEFDRKVGVAYVGDEPCYVVDDAGFKRHIPAESIDLQVIQFFSEMIKGSEDQISEQTAKMIGQDDIFSMAMIASQLKNLDKQYDALSSSGIPEEARAYLGMMGFKVHINIHGEVLEVEQPGMIDPDSE